MGPNLLMTMVKQQDYKSPGSTALISYAEGHESKYAERSTASEEELPFDSPLTLFAFSYGSSPDDHQGTYVPHKYFKVQDTIYSLTNRSYDINEIYASSKDGLNSLIESDVGTGWEVADWNDFSAFNENQLTIEDDIFALGITILLLININAYDNIIELNDELRKYLSNNPSIISEIYEIKKKKNKEQSIKKINNIINNTKIVDENIISFFSKNINIIINNIPDDGDIYIKEFKPILKLMLEPDKTKRINISDLYRTILSLCDKEFL